MKYFFSLLILLPLTLSGQWSQVGETLYGDNSEDRFGKSIMLNGDGDRIAIGAYYNDANGEDAGQVRVFDFDGSSWSQVGQDIYGQNLDDFAGTRVALSDGGSILAVGIMGHNNNTGRVVVYEEIGGVWTPKGNPIEGSSNSFFGQQLELSADGTRIIIAGSSASGNGISNNGLVQVYEFNGGNWSQLGQDFYGDVIASYLGTEVAMNASGTVITMSSPMHNGTAGNNVGRIYTYQFVANNWSQLGQTIEGTVPIQEAGRGLALNDEGTRLAIGSPYFNETTGKVDIFELNSSNTWIPIGQDIQGDATNNYFGLKLRFNQSGDILAVAAPRNSANGILAGLVRLYELDNNSNSWQPYGPDIVGEAETDRAGYSISLSNDGISVAVSSWYHDGPGGPDSGNTRIFRNFVLSVEENLGNQKIEMYPNPTSNNINILFDTQHPIVNIIVYDILGNSVLQQDATNSKSITLQTNVLATGLYTVSIRCGQYNTVTKFIKK
jgi:hypothetical protein